MRLFLDICTGAGLAAAAGIRPFLPALVAGVLALLNATIDFQHTDYAFLEKPWFLIVIAVAMVATFALERARGAAALESGPVGIALALIGIVLGALLFAGTLADHGYTAWPGLVGGAVCAALGHFAVRPLITRVRARVDDAVRGALSAYQEFAAFAGALLAVLVPPVSILLVGFLAWLMIGGRRREGEKYAGLRILR
ncbi:MAG: hypothetical protein JWP17_2476 [Solirubrobacterales bacterium]|jgi:hypothetical protein|nr:hypothetical protein [Solirubrobacterales bacterium]